MLTNTNTHGHSSGNGNPNRNSHCDPDSYSHCDGYCHSDGYCYSHRYSNADSDCHSYSNSNGYCYRYRYRHSDADSYKTFSYAKIEPVTKASADLASAAGVAGVTRLSISCQLGEGVIEYRFQYSTFKSQLTTLMTTFKALVALLLVSLSYIGARSASGATINIMPSKDNTLYEYVKVDGDRSNALGSHFFTGKTVQSELRRGVLAFDIAGSIPPGSTITSVTLSLNMSKTLTDDARTTELHKLLADWGEGTSHALGEEGDGAPATPNDATWRHRFFDMIFWTTQGGDFSATVSASQLVGPLGQYTWSSPQMVADVQLWLDNPASNFGWVVLGDEATAGSAKRFDTRESASPPVLTIQYTMAPRARPTPRPQPTPAPRP